MLNYVALTLKIVKKDTKDCTVTISRLPHFCAGDIRTAHHISRENSPVWLAHADSLRVILGAGGVM